MSGKSRADVVEEWQAGAGLILSSALGGAVIGGVLGMRQPGSLLGVAGFFVGGVLTFVLLSSVFYGRWVRRP
jgi:hypothetical protein